MLTQTIPSLTRYAMSHTTSRENAEDLLQDTLLLMLEKTYAFDKGNFNGWAFTMLHNIYRNKLRRKDIIRYCDYLPQCIEEIYDQEAADEKHDIATAIDNIASPHRETIELFLAGYKYEEIANLMDISTGTVKSRISRTRIKLQEMLQEYR